MNLEEPVRLPNEEWFLQEQKHIDWPRVMGAAALLARHGFELQGVQGSNAWFTRRQGGATHSAGTSADTLQPPALVPQLASATVQGVPAAESEGRGRAALGCPKFFTMLIDNGGRHNYSDPRLMQGMAWTIRALAKVTPCFTLCDTPHHSPPLPRAPRSFLGNRRI